MDEHAMADDAALRRRAMRRVGLRMGFYTHALVFVLVNLGLVALDTIQGGPRWSVWPLTGWGIGLAAHGIVTWFALRGDGVRERMLREEIERLTDARRGGGAR